MKIFQLHKLLLIRNNFGGKYVIVKEDLITLYNTNLYEMAKKTEIFSAVQ